MPQLTTMTSGSETSLNLRWPYQANVMKTLEANSISTGSTDGEMAGMNILSKSRALTRGPGPGFPSASDRIQSNKSERRGDRLNYFLRIVRERLPLAQPSSYASLTLVENENKCMRLDWRAISGPALTTATALIAILVDRNLIAVPNPAPLLICIVAFAGSLSGLTSSMISAAIAAAAAALFFFNHRATPGYDMPDLVRLAMLTITAAGTAVVTGLLRKKMMDTFAWERRHHATAERLSAALDQVDIGIVLLDSDTRAEFINRAFRDYFSLPDEKADSRPPFIALMYHGRDTGAFELPEEELNAFIAQRTELMRAGDSRT